MINAARNVQPIFTQRVLSHILCEYRKDDLVLRSLTVLLVVLLMSIAAGCSTPPPATDTPPDPLALIKEAADKLRAADTFRIDVNESGPDYTMYTEYATVFFRRASAQYVSPGIMQASLRVIAAGLPLDIQVFSRGAEQWYRAIWTADLWINQAFAPDFNPATLVAEESGFQAALDALIDLNYLGTTELENGTKVFQLAATANGPDVSALLGGLISPIGTVDVGVYIDQSTGYPARFVITEYNSPYATTPEPGQDAEPIVWTIDIYDINAPAALSTPEAMSDSAGTAEPSADARGGNLLQQLIPEASTPEAVATEPVVAETPAS